MENEKYLFVVSGAAGTGKDSVVKALREAHPEIEKTVSATTRFRERLSTAKQELAQQDHFAVKLVNNEIGPCAEELYQVICQRAGLNA